MQSTGIQATRKTLIVTEGASITIVFIERGHIGVANSLETTKSAVEPTGRLVDDEATVVTVADGMTPHTTVLEAIKAANPIALGQPIHLPNSKRPLVERYPALCQSKIVDRNRKGDTRCRTLQSEKKILATSSFTTKTMVLGNPLS